MIRVIGYSYNNGNHCLECTESFIKDDSDYSEQELIHLTLDELTDFYNNDNDEGMNALFDINEFLDDVICSDCNVMVEELNFITDEKFNDIFPNLDERIFTNLTTHRVKENMTISLRVVFKLDKIQSSYLKREMWIESNRLHELLCKYFHIALLPSMYELELRENELFHDKLVMDIPLMDRYL